MRTAAEPFSARVPLPAGVRMPDVGEMAVILHALLAAVWAGGTVLTITVSRILAFRLSPVTYRETTRTVGMVAGMALFATLVLAAATGLAALVLLPNRLDLLRDEGLAAPYNRLLVTKMGLVALALTVSVLHGLVAMRTVGREQDVRRLQKRLGELLALLAVVILWLGASLRFA